MELMKITETILHNQREAFRILVNGRLLDVYL